MRKVLFTLLLLAFGLLTNLSAKKGAIMLKGPNLHEVHSISSNGKWACGSFYDNQSNRAFMWNLNTNEKIYLGPKGIVTEAWGVADDGTVCGTFITTELGTTGVSQPTGGYWKDGKYTFLKDENGKIMYSTAEAISSDGQYIAGCFIDGTVYKPCVWKNGILERRLDSKNKSAMPRAISNDGKIVVGWYMNGNRCPCYWDTELKPLSDKKSFSSDGASISANKKYILARDAAGRFIYDLENAQKIAIPLLSEDPDNDGCTQILDDGTAILWEGSDALFGTGYVYKKDGTSKRIKEWLKDNWAIEIPEEFTVPSIVRFSSDMKRMVGLSIAGADEYGQAIYCPLAWISEQEIDLARPTSLIGCQMESTNNILLNWTVPSANNSALTGYRIYCNGKKLADVTPQECAYVDKTAGAMKLVYEVSALYSTNESEKLSTEINLKESYYAAPPLSFSGYQSNYNNVVLNWNSPNTGYDACLKLHNDHFAAAFGANEEMTFWATVKYNKDLINCYFQEFQIKAVEFYPCQKVDELTLIISSKGKELLSQTIDQSKLILGQNNVIVLEKLVALPEDGDVTVSIKVVQSGSAMPVGLAQDPAVEGGNLISTNGTTWTTLSELSYGEYTHNWMIGMLLDLKDPNVAEPLLPSMHSPASPAITNYRIYRDGEKIGEIKSENETNFSLNYADANVQPGKHVYEIEAAYGNSLASVRKTCEIFVQKIELDKCLAPDKLSAKVDQEKMKLTWDMPAYSDVSYTNWKYQTGIGYSGLSDWYYGVKYNPEKMKPFAGGNITNVNFMPISDATFALAIYENGKKIYSQDIQSYTLNKVNNLKLNTVIKILPYTEYLVAIHVSNVPSGKNPLGVDTGYPFADGRLISEDGVRFIDAEVDLTGNLMISMEVEKTTTGFNPGMTYKVYVGGVAESQILTENSYTKSLDEITASKNVTVNVAAIYPSGEKKSQDLLVNIAPESISSEEIVMIKVYPNPASSYIHIEGNVSSVSLFDMTGREVLRIDNTNTLNIENLTAGIYTLRSTVNGKAYANKIQIVK